MSTNDFFNNIDAGLDDFDKVEDTLKSVENLPSIVEEDNLPAEIDTDSEKNFALAHIKNVAKITEQASRELFKLALSSDSPRAWEVLSTMLKTNVDAAKTIMEEVDKAKKSGTGDEGQGQTNIVQNNFYSTADMIAIMKGKKTIDVEDAEVIDDV